MAAPETQDMVNHNESSTALRFLRCIVGEETYCLRMAHVRGIRRIEELQEHGNPPGLIGWLASKPDRIPVFPLATLLNRPGDGAQRTGKILVLKADQHSFGVLVQRLDSVIQVRASEVFPLPPVARNPAADFFEGVVKYNDTMLLALSPAGLYPNAPAGMADTLPSVHTPESLYTAVGFSTIARIQSKVMLFAVTPERTVTFGLSLSQVPQILRPLPLLPVPGAVPYVLGLADWRNMPLAVLDLSQRLGGPPSPLASDGRLLIARASGTRAFVGLAIRPQISIHHLPMAHRVSTRHVPLQESLLRGRFELENDLLLIPDIDRLLVAHNGVSTSENPYAGRDTRC